MPHNIENLRPEAIIERILTFSKLPQGRVQRFILQGPTEDSPTDIEIVAGLFPSNNPANEPGYAVIARNQSIQNRVLLNQTIMKFTVPEEVQTLTIPDDPDMKRIFDTISSDSGMPHITIVIGRYLVSRNEFVQLVCNPGFSPTTAVRNISQRASQSLAQL